MPSVCNRCGRVLQDGEICTCGQQEAPQYDQWGNPVQQPYQAQNPYPNQNPYQNTYPPQNPQYNPNNGRRTRRAANPGTAESAGRSAGQSFGKAIDSAGKALQSAVQQLPAATSGLQEFIVKTKNRLGFGTPESNSLGVYERNLNIVPDCIDTNENEVPIKQYNIAVLRSRMKFQRSEGRLQVTNKRIIFRATGRSLVGKMEQQQEFELDHLKGIEIRKDHRFSLMNYLLAGLAMTPFVALGIWYPTQLARSRVFMAILTYILGMAGLVPSGLLHKKFWLKLLCSAFSMASFYGYYTVENMYGRWGDGTSFFGKVGLILAIIASIVTFINWIMVCWRPNLVIAIKTDGTGNNTGAVLIRRKPNFLEFFFHRASGSEEYSGFSEVMPWVDTDVAMDELGAMIDDLQKLGDVGIQKWKL